MPFSGDLDDAAAAFDALERIERCGDDELLLVDNSPGLTATALAPGRPEVRVVPATDQRSSYYARNVGASAARNEWLLFIDSDCDPDPGILGAYLASGVAEDEGALAGAIAGQPDQAHVLARYQRDRGYLDQARNVEDSLRPFAVTANVMVRKRAWQSIGGFLEGIRSAGDTEFSWRLQDAGWRLAYRPDALVLHRHRESLRSFARLELRYAAGRAWLNRRYPGIAWGAGAGSTMRSLAAALRWRLAGERDRSRFRLIDALVIVLGRSGRLFANASSQPSRAHDTGAVVVLVDVFPEISETFIGGELAALQRRGCPARVESARRARRQDLEVARATCAKYWEDDTPVLKLRGLAWLAARHPIRCAEDVIARRRWRREEPVAPLRVIAPSAWRLRSSGERHVHAHFAAGAALNAMRIARLTGRTYSVTAHAFDIFQHPCNLKEKLERAAFVTTGCEYNVAALRELAPGAAVHEIVMGVDGERFRRARPYPGGRRVVAVGRLIEKKGFTYLLDAVALLERRGTPVRELVIAGEGPLRAALTEQSARLGLDGTVRFLGALAHESVQAAIEESDLLAMPCVVAADGDRDSMPVVVKEALALELPVVCSDEVGLPELIAPGWGRLVPPADPDLLADAIADLLALAPARRIEMGRAGRAHVLERCNVDREAERLISLIEQAVASQHEHPVHD